MAVSKRLRFAVFQRDDHTCQYCGRHAGEDGCVLEIDHILPRALGGKDEPANLVTACRDCNVGKSSSIIEEPTVAAPTIDARRWANAIAEAAEERRTTAADEKAACEAFLHHWPWSYPPDEWRPSVAKFVRMGLCPDDIERVLLLATDRTFGFEHCWRYFCKVCWSEVDAIRVRAGELLEPEEHPEFDVPAPVEPLVPRAPDHYPPASGADFFDDFMASLKNRPEPDRLVMLCLECDTRPAVWDGWCGPCRDWHYNAGTA